MNNLSQQPVPCRLVSMEPTEMTNLQCLGALHSRTFLGTFSSNIGAVFKAAFVSEVLLRERIDVPAPEPSRIEWEDTQ